MKIAFLSVVTIVSVTFSLRAGPPVDSPANDRALSVGATEAAIIDQLHDAAKGRDTAAIAQLIGRAKHAAAVAPAAVVALQRAVGACATLQNENDYASAVAVATQALAAVGSPREAKDTDNAEVLFLEAWLTSDVLQDPATALQLAKRAAILSPSDTRIARRVIALSEAVQAPGR